MTPFRKYSHLVAKCSLSLALFALAGCFGENVATVKPSQESQRQASDSDTWKPVLETLPPAPASQLLDDGRVFAHVPGEAAQLERFLTSLKAEHGIEIFVALYGYLDGESVEQRAHRLREAWAANETGVIVVYESGGSGMSFVANDGIDALLSRHDINMILQEAGSKALEKKGANNQVKAAVHTLAASLKDKLSRRHQANRVLAQKRMLIIATTLASIVLAMLIGIVISRFIRKSDRKNAEFYHFPAAQVGARYGAPFSGGTSAEIRFK